MTKCQVVSWKWDPRTNKRLEGKTKEIRTKYGLELI